MHGASSWVVAAAAVLAVLALSTRTPREGYAAFRREAVEMMHSLDYRLRNCESQKFLLSHAASELRRMEPRRMPAKDVSARLTLLVPGLAPHDPSQNAQLARAVEPHLRVLVEGVARGVAIRQGGSVLPGEVAAELLKIQCV